MLELTLVCHASTPWTEEGRYQGWSDLALSHHGLAEAAGLRTRLHGEPFDQIIASDLSRCVDTSLIAFPEAEMEIDPDWREMNFGEWEGLTYEECFERDGTRFRGWITHPAASAPPGGEAFGDFWLRVERAMQGLPTQGKVLVVTHSGTIRVALSRLLDLGFRKARRFAISSCGITKLEVYPEGVHILSVNGTR